MQMQEQKTQSTWDLLVKYKTINPTIKNNGYKKERKEFASDPVSQAIYSTLFERYTPYIKKKATYMLRKLAGSYEFEDCVQEIAECLKNAIQFIDLDKVVCEDKSKFSITNYLDFQISAKINSLNKSHFEFSKGGVRQLKFTEQEIVSEEQQEIINNLHSKDYENEWLYNIDIKDFVSTLNELEQKIFKLAMGNVGIPQAHKQVGLSRNLYLKAVKKVSEKAIKFAKVGK